MGKNIKCALKKLKKNGFKCLAVIDSKDRFVGTLSDGDLRNALLDLYPFSFLINKFVNRKPIFFFENSYSLENIKNILLEKNLPFVPIINRKKKIIQIIDLKYFKPKKISKEFNVPVVIMAGGKGKRLKPFTNILPKPLMPLNGTPIIEHIIKKFNSYGFKKFYISINYKSSLIKAFFSQFKSSNKINYIREKKPLGTAGSLKYLQNNNEKTFFVVNCDTIMDFNIDSLLKFHFKNKNDITIVSSMNSFKIPYGVINVGKGNLLKKINEKPSYNYLANTGCYLMKKECIKLIPKNNFFNFTDLIQKAINKKLHVKTYSIKKENWIDIGSFDGLNLANYSK